MTSATLPSPGLPRTLGVRWLLLGAGLGLDALLLSLAFDGGLGPAASGPAAAIRSWAPWIARGAIVFAAVFAAIAWLQLRHLLDAPVPSWRPSFLVAHFLSLALFFRATQEIYTAQGSLWAAGLWAIALASLVSSAALAAAPLDTWRNVLRQARNGWLLAFVSSVAAVAAVPALQALWLPTSRLTFRIVTFLLRPLLGSAILLEPERLRIGTKSFSVLIAPECSGLEGIGLFLVFSALGMFLFRRELRFPHCLTLIPLGIAVLFIVNAFRLAALILLGAWVNEDIAEGGFHSQAGWLAFHGVAFGLCLVAARWPWVWKDAWKEAWAQRPEPAQGAAIDATTALLLPFVAILFAGMLSAGMSANFEWAYGLRVLFGAVVLWRFRSAYREMNWRPGWPAFAAGIAVFFLWIGLDNASTLSMPAPLAAAPPGLRAVWLAIRSAGAVVFVPIAEELAFRAYLYRRLQHADFEHVSWTRVSVPALIASSALFGVMHGSRWPEGILAGLAYGLAMNARGRIGDAVFAHALTNALIAIAVIGTGRWQLW